MRQRLSRRDANWRPEAKWSDPASSGPIDVQEDKGFVLLFMFLAYKAKHGIKRVLIIHFGQIEPVLSQVEQLGSQF